MDCYKRLSLLKRVAILPKKVSPRDVRWNTLIDSILKFYNKLKKLGFKHYNGKISVANSKEVKK